MPSTWETMAVTPQLGASIARDLVRIPVVERIPALERIHAVEDDRWRVLEPLHSARRLQPVDTG